MRPALDRAVFLKGAALALVLAVLLPGHAHAWGYYGHPWHHHWGWHAYGWRPWRGPGLVWVPAHWAGPYWVHGHWG